MITKKDKLYRLFWNIFYVFFFRFSPIPFFRYRVFILKVFGAKISWSAHVYPSANIFSPKNLFMADYSCLGPYSICFNVDEIHIGSNSTISQYSHLCSASRNFIDKSMSLIKKKIIIENNVWIASDCFIGPGVLMENNSVALARSVVVKNVKKLEVVQGNPAKSKFFI